MPNPDDKLSDIPRIIPQRDDDAVYRRQRPEPGDSRKKVKPAKPAGEASGGGLWRIVAALGVLLALGAGAAAAYLYQQTQQLEAVLAQSNQRIADLEGRLSSTDDSVNQSSAAMQVKIKELGSEVDKLWASAWRKNSARLDELDGALKKATAGADATRKDLAAVKTAQSRIEKQQDVNKGLAISVEALKERQNSHESAIGRLNGSVNTLTNAQRAQEARLKETEQWVKSNIEFRKQVTKRLTRLENPASALPAE